MIGVRSALHTALISRGYDPIAVDPFYYPTSVAYRTILESQGFRVESCGSFFVFRCPFQVYSRLMSRIVLRAIELVPRITPLATGLEGWLNTFAFSFLNHLPPATRAQVIAEVCEKMKVDMMDDQGEWTCMYVRLRFKAWKD